MKPLLLALLAACTAGPPPGDRPRPRGAHSGPPTARLPYQQVCPDGATVDGIDVSYWQGSIDWNRVAADGIEFAFIRAAYGTWTDSTFSANWSGAASAGIVRGAYQYFLAHQGGEEQADVLLSLVLPLGEGELAPALDVETYANEGASRSQVRTAIAEWLDVVRDATGRTPIIYTSASAWTSLTGDWDPGDDVLLWVANWDVECPWIPNGWSDWAFWQTSDSGSVSGVAGTVDTDVFNGSLDDLLDLAGGDGDDDTGGEETCTRACTVSATEGVVVEEDGACACPTGSLSRMTDGPGHGGHSWWTTVDVPAPHYAEGINWMLDFERAGRYELRAHVPDLDGLTGQALYKVFHGDSQTYARLDQSAVRGGWASLGEFDFAAGSDQWVRLGDSYEREEDVGTRIAFDAIEVVPVGGGADDTGDDEDTGGTVTSDDTGAACACTPGETREIACADGGTRVKVCGTDCTWGDWSSCGEPAAAGCGCAAGGRRGAGGGLLAALAGLLALAAGRRRR